MSGSAPTPQAMTLPPASDIEKKSGWTLSYGLLQQVADSDAVREWGVGMEGVEAVLLTIAALGRPVVPRDDTAELAEALAAVLDLDWEQYILSDEVAERREEANRVVEAAETALAKWKGRP